MSTPVDMANEALTAAMARPGDTIFAFTDKSVSAQYVRLYYQDTLDQMLRAAHWNFARKMAPMSLLLAAPGTPENTGVGTQTWQPGVQPQPPWLYEYAYPPDCVLLRYISPQLNSSGLVGGLPIFSVPSYIPQPTVTLQPQRFLVSLDDALAAGAQRVALCNVEFALGVYTARVNNPDIWDPSFKAGFVAALAKRLVIPLSGNLKAINGFNQEAAQAILSARISDGNEGLTFAADTTRPPDWIRVRGYAGDYVTGSYYTYMWGNPSFLVL